MEKGKIHWQCSMYNVHGTRYTNTCGCGEREEKHIETYTKWQKHANIEMHSVHCSPLNESFQKVKKKRKKKIYM